MMAVLILQYLVIAISLVVTFVFFYANYYIFYGLKVGKKKLDRMGDGITETHIIREQIIVPALPVFDENQMRRELFYLYQEQIKDYVSAKVNILRDLSSTSNKLLLTQAELVKNHEDETNIQRVIDINEKIKNDTEYKLEQLSDDIKNIKFSSMNMWVEHQQQLVEA